MLSFAASCRKKPDPAPPVIQPPIGTDTSGTGSLAVMITNVAGNQPLSLHDTWYLNENGDSFRVFEYKYYISNIMLIQENATQVLETESYRLINQADATSGTFIIAGLPEGDYTEIRFLLGVDERRNTSGAQTGALDPIHGMFWDWNTGYIMAKLEGESPQSLSPSKQLVYHTGGFRGEYSVLRWVTLSFPEKVIVKAGDVPEIRIAADILEWFRNPTLIKFGETSGAMTPGEELSAIADNYADMFHITEVR